MELSPQQMAVVKAAGSCRVLAGPGSGKTATLAARITADIRRGFPSSTMAVITYTRAAAAEIASRLPEPVGYCGTLHGWLYGVMQGQNILTNSEALSLWLDTAKRYRAKWGKDEAERFLRTPSTPESQQVAKLYLAALGKTTTCLNSMVWAHAFAHRRPPVAERIYIDEAQDMAPYDIALFSGLTVPTVLVGDPHQAIYAFRGACTDWQKLNVPEYRLATNYRSAKEVVRYCGRIVGEEYQAKPGAPEGAVSVITAQDSTEEIEDIKAMAAAAGDGKSLGVLCRTNAAADFIREAIGLDKEPINWRKCVALAHLLAGQPAWDLWFHATQSREQFRVEPRSIAQTCINAGMNREEAALLQQLESCRLYPEEWPAHIARQPRTEDNLFVGTIHQAKGREWQNVIVAGADMIGLGPNRDMQEERNILFVACSRARRLLFITQSSRRQGKPRPACQLLPK